MKRSRTIALRAESVLESSEQKDDGSDGMSSGEESELKHPYEAQENKSGESEEVQRKKERAAQRSAIVLPAAFCDPPIALSYRVRACERATKKDHGRFIRTRAARARILRLTAYQASCGGEKNPPSSNLYLAPCSLITNYCLRVYQRRGARVDMRCSMHFF